MLQLDGSSLNLCRFDHPETVRHAFNACIRFLCRNQFITQNSPQGVLLILVRHTLFNFAFCLSGFALGWFLMSTRLIEDLNVQGFSRLDSPAKIKRLFPASQELRGEVWRQRHALQHILARRDRRLLVIGGPCSIHDPAAALAYAERLNRLRKEVDSRIFTVMRVYFEKPRTTIGWKGLIYDPDLDGSANIGEGLRIARELLVEITRMGLPAATEFLDPFVPQYLDDLIAWAAIGARTTESQTHRQMASGLSMPVGFKNGTDGSLQVALDAMASARHSHNFLGIDAEGCVANVKTRGNPWGHIVLRGGSRCANYDADSITQAQGLLSKAKLPPVVMVDCSHANSGKIPARQEDVWNSVIRQRLDGNDGLIGLMLESNLEEGAQPIKKQLKYGVSITDACMGWDSTERLFRNGFEALAPLFRK
jgi:3-deoxy-7-phosphoheptulonate synthase